MDIHTTLDIDAPVHVAWQIFGERFADVADWADAIEASSIAGPLEQGVVRTCDLRATPPFPASTVTEELTVFDRGEKRLTYVVMSGLPGMMRTVQNAWTFEDLGDDRTRVTSVVTAELAWWAWPMTPIVRRQLTGSVAPFVRQFGDHVEAAARTEAAAGAGAPVRAVGT
jgi:hypothetical protein